MWFELIVLENPDSPPLLRTAKCAIHTLLYSVCRSVYKAFFISYALWYLSSQGTVSSTMTRRFEDVDWITNIWSERRLGNVLESKFPDQFSLECLVACLLLCVAGWHLHDALFDECN